jgi:hypothetical protein
MGMCPAQRRPRRLGPAVESLEGRVVLSTLAHPASVQAAALVRGLSYLFLNGTVQGTYRETVRGMDAPITDHLHGSGSPTPLGRSLVVGQLTGVGQAKGEVRLTNARGSITLFLHGPIQGDLGGPDSGTYEFHTARGAEAYARVFGSGSVDVVIDGSTFSLTFHGRPNIY